MGRRTARTDVNPGRIVADVEEEGLWLSVLCAETGTEVITGIYLFESL